MNYEYNKALKQGVQGVLDLIPNLSVNNMILDVGSNTGMFIECMQERFPTIPILAFEPVKEYYEYSINNFKQKNICIENFALSDKNEFLEIHVAKTNLSFPGRPANIGWNTFVKEMTDLDNENNTEMVQCIIFDDYYTKKNIGAIDLVKIDTEGYEYKVLNGMRKFIKKNMPIILCEVGWGGNHPYRCKELEEFEYLYSIGYDTNVRQEIANAQGTIDAVFMPIEKC